jgi:hypothetical protein
MLRKAGSRCAGGIQQHDVPALARDWCSLCVCAGAEHAAAHRAASCTQSSEQRVCCVSRFLDNTCGCF